LRAEELQWCLRIQAHGGPISAYLLVDLGNDLDGRWPISRARVRTCRVPNYVADHYLVRKLDELPGLSRKVGKLSPYSRFFAIGTCEALSHPMPASAMATSDAIGRAPEDTVG
jgi:hypothetical protein